MLGLGSATEFEPPKMTNWSDWGWGLRFVKVEDENAYREEQASELQQQMKRLKHRVLATFGVLLATHVSVMVLTSNFSKRFLFPTHLLCSYAVTLSSAILLHITPKRYSEHACCGIVAFFELALLFTNPIRLYRLSLLKDVGPVNEMWLGFGMIELLESTRDLGRVVWAGTVDVLFHQTCDRIRTKVSLSKMLSVVIFFSSMLLSSIDRAKIAGQPPSCSTEDIEFGVCSTLSSNVTKEAGKAREIVVNLFFLFLILSSNWYNAYSNERKHRENWALHQQAKHYEKSGEAQRMLESLLVLFCPVVVHVRAGKITRAVSFAEQFGPGIESLEDLPTETVYGQVSAELMELTDEITRSEIPTKRNVVIRPRGGMQVFKCTVCAVVAEDRTEILLGFQILESFESPPRLQALESTPRVMARTRDPLQNQEPVLDRQFDVLSKEVKLLQMQMKKMQKELPVLVENKESSTEDVCVDALHETSSARMAPSIDSVDDHESRRSEDCRRSASSWSAPAPAGQTSAQSTPPLERSSLGVAERDEVIEPWQHRYLLMSAFNAWFRTWHAKHARKAKIHRLSPAPLNSMRQVSQSMNCETIWIRIMHTGHGQDLWKADIESMGLVVVHGPSPTEGSYVMIPPWTAPEEVVYTLFHRNLSVRKRSGFPDMKRANKSRVTVKCEPFTVSPTATDKPRLVPTERFARFEMVQPHRFKSTQPFPPVNPRWSQLQPAPISGHEETNSVSWTDQACGGSNCTRDDLSGSLSLDSLARIAPMLDQKSRSDHLDMLDDLDL
jgi:hypothetical protein